MGKDRKARKWEGDESSKARQSKGKNMVKGTDENRREGRGKLGREGR